MGFFNYVRGRRLSAGNAQFGFAGDATGSNYVPHLATGVWGQVNARPPVKSQRLSYVPQGPNLPVYGLPASAQQPGFSGLITNGSPDTNGYTPPIPL